MNVETPELNRQSEIIHSGRAATVQEFLDWLLDEAGYRLGVEDPNSRTGRLLPEPIDRQRLMEQFFKIDPAKIETERRAILRALGEAQP